MAFSLLNPMLGTVANLTGSKKFGQYAQTWQLVNDATNFFDEEIKTLLSKIPEPTFYCPEQLHEWRQDLQKYIDTLKQAFIKTMNQKVARMNCKNLASRSTDSTKARKVFVNTISDQLLSHANPAILPDVKQWLAKAVMDKYPDLQGDKLKTCINKFFLEELEEHDKAKPFIEKIKAACNTQVSLDPIFITFLSSDSLSQLCRTLFLSEDLSGQYNNLARESIGRIGDKKYHADFTAYNEAVVDVLRNQFSKMAQSIAKPKAVNEQIWQHICLKAQTNIEEAEWKMPEYFGKNEETLENKEDMKIICQRELAFAISQILDESSTLSDEQKQQLQQKQTELNELFEQAIEQEVERKMANARAAM